MRTFKAYFKKEIIESIRQYRYVIIAIGIVFFAVSNPILMKMLPKILSNQMSADLSSLFVVTRRAALINHIGDLLEIGFLVIIFTLSSTLSDELISKKLVFPYSKGCSPAQMVVAKFIHHVLATSLIIVLGFIINYYYVNILITGDDVPFLSYMLSAVLVGVYFMFNIGMCMLFSSLFKKGFVAGLISIAVSYSLIPISGINAIKAYMPYRLISAATAFSIEGAVTAIITAAAVSTLFIALTCYRMSKAEVI